MIKYILRISRFIYEERQKTLRKRVVLKLLSNPNHKPSETWTPIIADRIIGYINDGECVHVEY